MSPPTVPPRDVTDAVFTMSPDIVVVIDLGGTVSYANGSAEHLLGRSMTPGRSMLEVVHPDDRHGLVELLADAWEGAVAGHRPSVVRAAHADGSWTFLEIVGAQRLASDDGTRIAVVLRDVTSEVEAERRLRAACEALGDAATHDALTGLPNRAVLEAVLDRVITCDAGSSRAARIVVARLADVDSPRERCGSDRQGSCVRWMAETVADAVDAGDVVAVADLGTVVVVPNDDRTEATLDALAERIEAALAAGLARRHVPPLVRIAVGTAPLRAGGPVGGALDAAIRDAVDGGDGARMEPPGTAAPVDHRPASARSDAPSPGEVEPCYRPVVDVRTERLVAFDAVARWQRSPNGPVVIDSDGHGLADADARTALTRFVTNEACEQLAVWQRRHGERAPLVSLNVSVRHLDRIDLAGLVDAAIERVAATASGLCLVLTDTHALAGRPSMLDQLHRLRSSGVRLGWRDHGTGPIPLHRLRELGVDSLTIDRSFVRRLGRDRDATAIVRSSIDLAASFGLTTVAEGVTTADERRRLIELGCDRIHGAAVSPAVDQRVADAMLRSVRSAGGQVPAHALASIASATRRLATVDEAFEPAHEEIAALADVDVGQVRRSVAPPRATGASREAS